MLVIGVGNDLRRDDGVGRVVASTIEEMALPGVRVMTRSQLVPELVEEIAGSDRVVVVDASIDSVSLTARLAEAGTDPAMTHHGSPEALVSLARTIGQAVPDVYVVGVPAADLGLGEGLTPPTAALVSEAVETVLALLGR
ncbi:MAG: hydrogenase maturation protease [Acidimicrobiia bacterium]